LKTHLKCDFDQSIPKSQFQKQLYNKLKQVLYSCSLKKRIINQFPLIATKCLATQLIKLENRFHRTIFHKSSHKILPDWRRKTSLQKKTGLPEPSSPKTNNNYKTEFSIKFVNQISGKNRFS